MKPLATYEPFQDWMGGMSNPVAGILAGAIFTAVIQSSSVTTGVVLALAFEGLITLEAGLPSSSEPISERASQPS
jgi:phosphate:Na+ symporter